MLTHASTPFVLKFGSWLKTHRRLSQVMGAVHNHMHTFSLYQDNEWEHCAEICRFHLCSARELIKADERRQSLIVTEGRSGSAEKDSYSLGATILVHSFITQKGVLPTGEARV